MDDPQDWHRRFAVEGFNGAWDLIDQADRTADDDVEMFLRAAASRWHWGHVGGAQQIGTGDWQIAHAASLLGWGDVAVSFAARNLAIAEAEGWDGWQLASAHEGMARAYAAAADAAGRERHVAAARAALERETDAADAKVIADQLASVPEV